VGHSLSEQDCFSPVLQLGPDSIVARGHVRLLGVSLSSDLSLDRQVFIVSASSFYWLRQLQRSQRSFSGHEVGSHTRTLVCRVTQRWLLQRFSGVRAESDDQQTATSVERCSSCGQRYAQVRPRLIVSRDSSIPTYTGWMFPSESCISSASWRSTVCTVKRLRTSWNCANQLQMSRRGNVSDPPPDSS